MLLPHCQHRCNITDVTTVNKPRTEEERIKSSVFPYTNTFFTDVELVCYLTVFSPLLLLSFGRCFGSLHTSPPQGFPVPSRAMAATLTAARCGCQMLLAYLDKHLDHLDKHPFSTFQYLSALHETATSFTTASLVESLYMSPYSPFV